MPERGSGITAAILKAVTKHPGKSCVEICHFLQLPRTSYATVSSILNALCVQKRIFRIDSTSTFRQQQRVWRYFPEVENHDRS